MAPTKVKNLEHKIEIEQSIELATVAARKNFEKVLIGEHYKLNRGRFVKIVNNNYRLEIELAQAPAPNEPLWYIALFNENTGVQLYSASGHSY
ncbi:MAG: hypothetical protein QW063_00860, partial [Candidatus Nanoarchaeia archaeon]